MSSSHDDRVKVEKGRAQKGKGAPSEKLAGKPKAPKPGVQRRGNNPVKREKGPNTE